MTLTALPKIRDIHNLVDAVQVDDPQIADVLLDLRVLLGELEIELDRIVNRIGVTALAAYQLRPGDILHWQGTVWGIVNLTHHDPCLTINAVGVDGDEIDIEFAAVEAVLVAYPRVLAGRFPGTC